MTSKSWLANQSLRRWELCFGSLSCWKTYSLGSRLLLYIGIQWLSPQGIEVHLRIHGVFHICDVPKYPSKSYILNHNISLTVDWSCYSIKASPDFLQQYFWLPEPKRLNLDLLDHTALAQSSIAQSLCAFAQAKHLLQWVSWAKTSSFWCMQ